MVIRDKQELKRCVKQAVRRAQVVETDLAFDVAHGNMGVSELLQTWAAPSGAPNDAFRRATEQETPFEEGASAMFAALSALELPTHNLNNAQTIQQSYDRGAYLREVLDAMRARRVLVRVAPEQVNEIAFEDDRLAPMLTIDASAFFASGRYGVDYQARAGELEQLLSACGAHDLYAEYADASAVLYALIPVSEDTGCVLHLHAVDEELLYAMAAMFEEHPLARAIISCDVRDERALLSLARRIPNIMPQLGSFAHMREALAMVNTRFVPFSSSASLPEQMLGRWENARETIWQTLLEAYLPLARSGYELTSDAIVRDVTQLLGGNLDSFYRENN